MDSSHRPSPEEDQLVNFSAAFDQLGVGSQLTQTGDDLGIPSDRQRQLIAEWQQTAMRLKSVPVKESNVADSVLNRIAADSVSLKNETVRPAAQPTAQRGGRQQLAKILALFTSSVAMLYVALQVATHEQSLNRSAEVLASFSFDPQGWDVVVVTVSDEQAEQLSQDLRPASQSGDLKMMPLLENEDSKDDSVGVMMASKETSQKLLVKLAETPSLGDAEWNPQMVGELGREELLKRFANSMKTPTQSDLYFREVIVVTSDQENGFQVTAQPTNSETSDNVIASADATGRDSLSRQQSKSVLMKMQNNRQRPVLVVLKRRAEPSPESQGRTDSTRPTYAVYL